MCTGMELVKQRTQNRRRIFAASACLLAVVFLYAPFAAAAWSSQAMACCTGGFAIFQTTITTKAPANSTSAKDCGHDMGGMMNCSMSCCQDPDKSVVVTSLAFVLPPVDLHRFRYHRYSRCRTRAFHRNSPQHRTSLASSSNRQRGP